MSLVFLPILVPLVAGALGLLAWRSARAQAALAVGSGVLHVAVAVALLEAVRRGGPQLAQAGDWPPPFGIGLAADALAAVMVLLAAVLGLACVLHAVVVEGGARRPSRGAFPLVSVLLAGVSGAFLTADLFNLFVWFEVLLIASFVLVARGGARAHLAGGIRYLALNLVGSALFLSAVGVVYALTGTLRMADLPARLAGAPPGPVAAALGVLLVAFGIKAAVFPLFFWLPASYPAPPPSVGALFSGLLTKVGVYAMLRCLVAIFPAVPGARTALLVVAALTMVTGVLGAVAQTDVRRLLSFHVVSQIGYLVLGVALGTPLAIAAAIFFTVHVALAKAALFLVGGLAERAGGSFDLGRLGGLGRREPWIAAVFLVAALSLAGIPPLSGFVAKLAVVQAGLAEGEGALVAVALGVGVLTLFSMTKIWLEAFWKPAPAGDGAAPAAAPPRSAATLLPAAALAGFSLVLGLAPAPLVDLSLRAAGELLAAGEAVAARGGP